MATIVRTKERMYFDDIWDFMSHFGPECRDFFEEMMEVPDGEDLDDYLNDAGDDEMIAFLKNCKEGVWHIFWEDGMDCYCIMELDAQNKIVSWENVI